MTSEGITKAMELAEQGGRVMVATADADGEPHLATAGKVARRGANTVALDEWFCPRTMQNVAVNPRVSVVVWDPRNGDGMQLVGRVAEVEDLAVMNGYDPRVEPAEPLPQVQRELRVRVDEVLHFSRGPHSDVQE